MILVEEIVNSIFTSKTYILYQEGKDRAWLVDIGDIEPVIGFLDERHLSVEGVILTHGHFDHIYGLKSIMELFPDCHVYATEFTRLSLASDKLNMSRYHETPFTYEGDRVIIVHEGDSVRLFGNGPVLQFYETPGHNPGCLTAVAEDAVFTGDAYIPGVGANTQLPHADKVRAQESLERILKLAEGRTVFSGHKV